MRARLRVLAEQRRPDVPEDRTRLAEERDLPAMGACERPTPQERDVVKQALLGADPALSLALAKVAADGADDNDDGVQLQLGFGCKDAGGLVISVAYDRDQWRGTWKVLRASGAAAGTKFAELARFDGEARRSWMEYSKAITLEVFALADLDGDGVRDVLLQRDQQEIGAPNHRVTLSLWSSRRGKVVALGALDSYVRIDGAWAPGQPLVLRTYHATGAQLPRYRCVLPAGTLGSCKQIAASQRADRAMAVILFEEEEPDLPYRVTAKLAAEARALDVLDAAQLEKLLRELRAAPADRAALLAEAAAARAARDAAP